MPSKALLFLPLCIFVRLLTPGVASPLTAVHPPVLYLSHDSEDEILRCRVESKVEPTSIHWLFWASVDAAPIRIGLDNPLYRANGIELTIRRESNVSRVLGLYQCVVAIENHKAASLPSIVKELEHKELKVALGSPALLNCSTSYASVNWTFNGQNFIFKNHQSMSFSVDGLEKLVIRAVGENDTGTYTCETTGERRILKTFELITKGKKIQDFSQFTTVALSPLHQSTFLDCVCHVPDARLNKSIGQGQAVWRRNGTILEPQPLLDSTCLSIIRVSEPGLYTCSVTYQKNPSNKERTYTREVVTYNVTRQDTNAEPNLTDATDNEVSCLIDVRWCPDVTWLFHNGKKKHVFDRTSCMNSKGRMSAKFHGYGIYQCMMETTLGWKTTSRVITAPTATETPTTETPSSSGKELSSQRTDSVTTTSIAYLTAASPYEPTNSVPTESFTVKSVSPTSISVELSDPAAWQTNEIAVFYRDTSSVGDGNVKRETMDVASKSHTIQKLKPNTTYEVWIEPVFPNGKVPEGGNKHKKKMKTLMAPPLPEENTESKDNMFLGIVLGSVLGVLALLLVAVLVVVAINRRRRRKEEETSASRQQYEKARKAEGDAYAFPEAPTPCLESPKRTVSPSPPPKKVAFDDCSDIEDDPPPPGYAPVVSPQTAAAAAAAVTESRPAQQPSARQSTPSVSKQDIDDGIPNYAQLNEASKIKYRRKTSARRLREIEGLDDGIEVLDYAELEMPQGGPIPTRSPHDEVDYAEIDFTRTTRGDE